MARRALVLRHVHFEDLGFFAQPLAQAGYDIRYEDVGEPGFCSGDPLESALLVVLGGPVGVYEEAAYPFLATERAFLASRLEAGRPTLGICLGAQLMAAALGARVFPSGLKEIGFSPLDLTEAGARSPLRHLSGVSVLHWHGDTYTLPAGAEHLAASALIEQQAFALGSHALGLQFHAEAQTGESFERWLVGHAAELAGAGIDPARLREEGRRHDPALKRASQALLAEWLAGLPA